LPTPEVIFRDMEGSHWNSFQAAQTSFSFDGTKFTRRAQVQRVHLRKKPFMQGGMRLAYGMVLDPVASKPDQAHWMCGKRLFQDVLHQDGGFQAHSAFCRSTAVAHYFAKRFRTQVGKANGGRLDFGFVPCNLYSPVSKGEEGYHFCGEKWLKGHFVKLNSNAGFVNETEFGEHSEIAQAFSHYTFDRSKGELMVVDLQGICGERARSQGEGNELYFLLTDPQVHSSGTFERFGPGDLADQGIRAFFQHHRCNEWCRLLDLKKEHDLCDPTNVVKMPGVAQCIQWMRSEDSRAFFRDLRKSCRASSIVVPREVYADWQDIKVWATDKGGKQAEKLLQARLDKFYATARYTEHAPSTCAWTVERWEQQLQAWRTESGAPIVAWPPNWRGAASGGVKEIWIFTAETEQSDACMRDARKRIRETFAAVKDADADAGAARAPSPADAGGDSAAAAEEAAASPDRRAPEAASSGPTSWCQYQDHKGNKYWYREPDGKWFWEADPGWTKFLDSSSGIYWWWHIESGDWFYEPKPGAG